MKRRIVLKNLATATGGLLVLPAWANRWTPAAVKTVPIFLTPQLDRVLTDVVDTIIPQTDTPGAKALDVPAFVQKMVVDCYEPDVQVAFADGLKKVDETALQKFGKSFTPCDIPQRLSVLATIEKAPETTLSDFYKLVRQLTIQGFTTSEYVMTHFYNYQPIPGHYYGCVPVSEK